MQPPPSLNNPWVSMQQTPGFPHLKTVPPPPPPSVLTPVRFPQLLSPQPLLGKQMHNLHNDKPRLHNGSPLPSRGQYHNRGQHHNRGQQHKQGQKWGRGFNKRVSNKRNITPATTPAQSTDKASCDTCDKTFPDEIKLAEHIAEHKVCGLEGCKFSAHPKIIANHIEMQHRTGLFKRLVLSQDTQEIQRWREERKKRFPTKANLELKQSATKERNARGERLSEPKGRFNNQRRGQWNQRPNFKNQTVTKISNLTNSNKNIKEISKEEITPEVVKTESDPIPNPSLIMPRALVSLACSYANSDSGSDSEGAPDEIPISHELQGPEPPQKKIRVEPPHHKLRREFDNRHQPTVKEQYLTHHRPPTLLQKLLANEIRHERNVILQCVRHIVLNNFFQ